MKKKKNKFPDKKISETFLNFASPIIDSLGNDPTQDQIESVLKIAFTVWNSVVLDTVRGNSEFVSQIKILMKDDPISSIMFDQMINRKLDMFPDDNRMIGDYKLTKKNNEWRLRAEARDPYSIP